MIFAMLKGDLPPRGLNGVTEKSTVDAAKQALRVAYHFPKGSQCRLFRGKIEMSDDSAQLAEYGVEEDALIQGEVAGS